MMSAPELIQIEEIPDGTPCPECNYTVIIGGTIIRSPLPCLNYAEAWRLASQELAREMFRRGWLAAEEACYALPEQTEEVPTMAEECYNLIHPEACEEDYYDE